MYKHIYIKQTPEKVWGILKLFDFGALSVPPGSREGGNHTGTTKFSQKDSAWVGIGGSPFQAKCKNGFRKSGVGRFR